MGGLSLVKPTRVFRLFAVRIGEKQHCGRPSVGQCALACSRRFAFLCPCGYRELVRPGSRLSVSRSRMRSESTFRGKCSLLQRPDDTIRIVSSLTDEIENKVRL